MTLPLPHPVVEDQQVQQNFEAFARAFPVGATNLLDGITLELASTGTMRKVAFGIQLVATGGTANVTHGLGTTPAAVLAVTGPGVGNTPITWAITAAGSSTFTLGNAGGGLDANAYWLAIG